MTKYGKICHECQGGYVEKTVRSANARLHSYMNFSSRFIPCVCPVMVM